MKISNFIYSGPFKKSSISVWDEHIKMQIVQIISQCESCVTYKKKTFLNIIQQYLSPERIIYLLYALNKMTKTKDNNLNMLHLYISFTYYIYLINEF